MVSRAGKADKDDNNELEVTFAEIEKRYGTIGYPIRRRGGNIVQPVRIPTGAFVLDFALLGGIPMGKVTHLIGNKHSGKSMLASKIMGYAQRQMPDRKCVLIDIEKGFEPIWARKLGCDIDNLEVLEADTGEMAADMADAVVQSKETSLLVIDSLAAMVPTKEAESSAEDHHMALQARLIGHVCRKMISGMTKERMRGHDVAVLFINQWRTKIGQMFGDPRTAPGGYATEHFPSLDISLKNKEKLGKDEAYDIDTVVENEHAFTIRKWRGNNGPRTGEFRVCRVERPDFCLHEGDVDDSKTLLSYAKKFGAYSGGGGSWRLDFAGYEHKVKNIDEAVLFLNENREWYWSLYNWCIREQAIHLNMDKEFIGRFEI